MFNNITKNVAAPHQQQQQQSFQSKYLFTSNNNKLKNNLKPDIIKNKNIILSNTSSSSSSAPISKTNLATNKLITSSKMTAPVKQQPPVSTTSFFYKNSLTSSSSPSSSSSSSSSSPALSSSAANLSSNYLVQSNNLVPNKINNINNISISSHDVISANKRKITEKKIVNCNNIKKTGAFFSNSRNNISSNNNKITSCKKMSTQIQDDPKSDCASINTTVMNIVELEYVGNVNLAHENEDLNAFVKTSESPSMNSLDTHEIVINEAQRSQEFSLEKSKNDDLVSLNNLNEELVLEQLKERFLNNKIYTYIGDILIAMNPLKAMSIYSKQVSNFYQKCENVRDKLPPHVYATAEQCFREMIRSQQSQCILISGESGSGKTETCKYLVQHLLNRTKPFELCLNAKIQEVNPLLEAFGNAKTRINDNSSRFGKYLEIYFEQDGTVVGAKFKEYLLEKSRVVYQNEFESTFHIFYLLFAGLTSEQKLHYGLTKSPQKYRFMSNTNLDNCMSIENEEQFLAIKQRLQTIGFLPADIENLIKILVSVLLIGDIQFSQKKGNNNDAVQVKNMEIIEAVCDLLELEPTELNEALVSDVQITRGEEIKRERNMVQVCDVRDALAKAFYGRLFSWIVNQINHHIQPVEGVNYSYSIGLLDIFGFENFEKNSFEQMCINLANEQLHQLFTKYIFKLEIQECLDEQIELNSNDLVTYQDNQNILDLFLEKRTGIFALLDEESRFPKATDQSLAIKLHQTLTNVYSDVYVAPKNVGTSFSILHYAGQVLYNVEGFLEKNRDFLPNNLFYAARNSNNFLVQELFQCKLTRKGTIAPSDRQSRLRKSMANTFNMSPTNSTSDMNTQIASASAYDITQAQQIIESSNSSSRVRFSTVSTAVISASLNSSIINNGSSISSTAINHHLISKNDEHRNSISLHVSNQYASDKVLPLTVACHFKNSLHELIEKINKCKAYFIRCIKPSPNQENVFLNEFVTKQLRYCSLMHVCKIRKCGFPYRIKFEEFLRWYKAIEICILKRNEDNSSATSSLDFNNNIDKTLQKCLTCLEYAKITNYKVGKSKLFLRYWHIDILNSLAKKLETNVLIAQKITRGWLVRNRLKKKQQNEVNMFMNQVTFKSNDVSAKLRYSQDFAVLPHQIKALADKDVLNLMNRDAGKQMLAPISANTDQDWPDINEINSALEEFDSMLTAYENNFFDQINQKENTNVLMSSKNHVSSSSSSKFQYQKQNVKTSAINTKPQSPPAIASSSAHTFLTNNNITSKISPSSVYHLVTNNNNKNDSTLKKRNALVAFEFKTLLDKVAPLNNPESQNNITSIEDQTMMNIVTEEISDVLMPSPPYIYSDLNHFDLNNQPNHSPPSLSTSSSSSASSSPSSSSANNISSSSSSSTSTPDDNKPHRSVSPSQIVRIRYVSPPNNTNNQMRSKSHQQFNKSSDHNVELNVIHSYQHNAVEKNGYFVLNSDELLNSSNNPSYNHANLHNSSNVTIWREEINTRNNVQQQIKKQTELSQKIEDSKKNIPEWKRNLLKQKEMKKITLASNSCQNNISNLMNNIPETPELMKHNIFIKKGLATMKT